MNRNNKKETYKQFKAKLNSPTPTPFISISCAQTCVLYYLSTMQGYVHGALQKKQLIEAIFW